MIRLLPHFPANGPCNMAADEALLESAVTGVASLRFYSWSEAAVSLGYFQPENLRRSDPRLASLPFVRRQTGGGALVHHHEVTYALALPTGSPWQTKESWLCRMHAIIAAALRNLGVPIRDCSSGPRLPADSFLCFHKLTSGDLLIDSAKIVGSAQRRQRGALLQHGAILLAQSDHAPSLPGVRELCGQCLRAAETVAAISKEFVRQTGWNVLPGDWTPSEQKRKSKLAATKYSQDAWNCKR